MDTLSNLHCTACDYLKALEEVDLAVASEDGEDAVRVADAAAAPAPNAPALATVHGHVALVVLICNL